jgi:hypothetical protein
MTDPTLMYVQVRCSAGHRHRRYPRWSKVDPSARLPEQQWRWRWRLDDRCAVAIPGSLKGRAGHFQPCGGRPVEGMDLCGQHARLERRISGRGFGFSCTAPLLALDAIVDVVGGST